jgi:hypothetical protein
MGLHLDTRSVAALEERTEGWITGLQMAALSMRDREDVRGSSQDSPARTATFWTICWRRFWPASRQKSSVFFYIRQFWSA